MNKYSKAPASVKLYHGTNFKNLRSIAEKGLENKSGQFWSAIGKEAVDEKGAVYLTPDLEKAVRYAVGASRDAVPMVLEVVITNPKRFNIMREDPMDQSSDAWNYENSNLSEITYEVESDITGGLEKIIEKYSGDKESIRLYDYLKTDGIEDFDGINIYKLSLKILNDYEGMPNRNDLMRVLKKMFPVGEFTEYLDIREDGTLKLSENYWETREQLYYLKPIPPSAIKGVWVRLGDFENIDEVEVYETSDFGVKELPHETAYKYEKARDILVEMLHWNFNNKEEEDFIDQAEELDDLGFDDIGDEVRGLFGKEEGEIKEMIYEFENWLDEDWGNESVSNRMKWGLVSPKDSLKLRVK